MLLLLDSSGNYLVAGLAMAEHGIVAEAVHRSGSPESRNLSAVVDALLESAGRPRLEGVAAGTGPGTFIGTRMAVSFANGLAAATGCKLAGVNSLAAMLAVHPPGTAVVRDARQQHVYVYIGDGGSGSTSLVPVAGLGQLLRSVNVQHVVVEAARLDDAKGVQRLAEIARVLGDIAPVQFVEMVPVEGLRLCTAGQPPQQYIEPEYCKGFL